MDVKSYGMTQDKISLTLWPIVYGRGPYFGVGQVDSHCHSYRIKTDLPDFVDIKNMNLSEPGRL